MLLQVDGSPFNKTHGVQSQQEQAEKIVAFTQNLCLNLVQRELISRWQNS